MECLDVRAGDAVVVRMGESMTKQKVPKQLDAIADIVLAYKPKPKTLPARRRKRRATKIAKAK
jgi:hypothetical protein